MSNAEYYRARAKAHMRQASEAATDGVRDTHLAMVKLYLERADALGAQRQAVR